MSDRAYAVRYQVEPWGKPVPCADTGGLRVVPGVTVSRTDHGYTDTLLLVSVLRDEGGGIASIALFDSDSGCGQPSPELLLAVRDHIDHFLQHHCAEDKG